AVVVPTVVADLAARQRGRGGRRGVAGQVVYLAVASLDGALSDRSPDRRQQVLERAGRVDLERRDILEIRHAGKHRRVVRLSVQDHFQREERLQSDERRTCPGGKSAFTCTASSN